MLTAIAQSGIDIEGWLKSVKQPIDPNYSKRNGNPEGSLYGEVLVFTGALEIPRSEAADMADGIGCRVETGVNRKTTMLIVGNQDIKRLAGHEKSSKHRKAEELILKGHDIRILSESDFKQLVKLAI